MTSQPGVADESNPPHFGGVLRARRVGREWSLRDLGERIRFNRGYIGKVEQGDKFPERQFAELADRALGANGFLVAAWRDAAEERRKALVTGRMLTASTKDSLKMIAAVEDSMDLTDLEQATTRLSTAYLGTAPAPMLHSAVELRGDVLRRLRSRQYRPNELADLYQIAGRLQGVLAYAALDLGDSAVAMTHADAALVCAENSGDRELRAWVRGTQSLIARFDGNYSQALASVTDGLAHSATSASRLRLICGYAQCKANLGDSAGSNRALDQVQHEREKLIPRASERGIFDFSEAKQHYYAGSSLIWLVEASDADRAAREASEAIRLWENGPEEGRSLDDEALARVYQATAYLKVGKLDEAAAAVRPVLDLPPERRISWIHKRVGRMAEILGTKRFAGTWKAEQLRAEIRAFAEVT
ncbi:helix-turn-helix transcriptional regulator [Solwaraspora sp. WMMA2080]|uniref:helix-turn-helix domain-containing protein n=1 Tax=unclassified Solwaraspora TaxID=2627926 RepID=UPI00248BCD7B|nr:MULTISPECIES: helix-turn-helix transcriptional regulator [unclassified Solwaraspora]WBB98609.1 helix-turn-helix transcriptional regulator [Solwaraspora sp. WMMA2059]WBC22839.1 helix-turn-helix transcriptional regulator [Solwaraspora sp. WMMA2080]